MNVLRAALIALSVASLSLASAQSFFGATVPSRYFHSMLSSLDQWTVQQRDFFRMRAIQANGLFPSHTVMLVDRDEDMALLGKYFAPFREKVAEYGSFNCVTSLMAEGYPSLAARLPRAEISEVLFHGCGSPAEYFMEKYDSGSAFSPKELATVLRLLEEGSRWEHKYPKLDFMLPLGSPFVDRLTLSFPKLRLRPTWRGYRIRDIFREVQMSK